MSDVKQTEEKYIEVSKLYREQKIDADTYYKCLVCVAHDFCAAGHATRAAGIVQMIPVEYFREKQPAQMNADPAYSQVAYYLALMLVQNGLVHMGPRVIPNMPGASA